MRRAGLPPRALEAAHHPRQAGRVQALVEARLEPAAQGGQGPCAAAIALRLGPTQDHRPRQRRRGLGQRRRSARLGTVAQARQPLGVVAPHRVAQRLALHPRQPRRLRARPPLQRARKRQHPPPRAAVPLPPRQPAEFLRTAWVRADHHRCRHLIPPQAGSEQHHTTDALDKRRVERMAFFPVALPRHATLLPFGTRARLRLGCSDQALTKRVYAFSACSTKARSFSRSSLML